MLEEEAEVGVGVGVDGGLEHRQEDVLQHLTEVGNKVPGLEDVAGGEKRRKTLRRATHGVARLRQNQANTV